MSLRKNRLDDWTAAGFLAELLEGQTLRCLACAHACVLRPGQRGVCRARYNDAGVMRVPWGYVAGAQLDPIEKKPFAHVLPGRMALTFGMLGCNFHCDFCQNWPTTQVLRDATVDLSPYAVQRITPEALVRAGQEAGAAVMVSSYNEPLITSEWAIAIFERAHANGMLCAMVSNGYASAAVRQALRPHLDALKVDLKTMQEEQYRQMGGSLAPVLETIRWAFEAGLWVEVVTLIIPGFNDSPDELWQAARFLASISADIPWHVTAFHPDYRRLQALPTTAEMLRQAAEIGQEAGLHFVYAGNLPGRVGSLEDTVCPACQTVVVQRRGYTILKNVITPQGCCPVCGAPLPGRWQN
jgi:pyruvate formate lyase activating enzyme